MTNFNAANSTNITDFTKDYYATSTNLKFDDAMKNHLDEGGQIEFSHGGKNYYILKEGNNYVARNAQGGLEDGVVQIGTNLTVDGFVEVGLSSLNRNDRLYIGQKDGSSDVSAIVAKAGLDITAEALGDPEAVLKQHAEFVEFLVADARQPFTEVIYTAPTSPSPTPRPTPRPTSPSEHFLNLTDAQRVDYLENRSPGQKKDLLKDLANVGDGNLELAFENKDKIAEIINSFDGVFNQADAAKLFLGNINIESSPRAIQDAGREMVFGVEVAEAVVQQNPSLNNLYSTIDGGFVGVAEQILSRKFALQNAVEQQVDSSEIVNLMAVVLEWGGSVSNEFQDLLAADPLMAVQVHQDLSKRYDNAFAVPAAQLLTELSNQQLKRFEAAADNLPQVLSGSEFTALNSADRTAYLETLTPAQKNDLLKDLGNAGKDSSDPDIIARADKIAEVITSFDGVFNQADAAKLFLGNINIESSPSANQDAGLEIVFGVAVAEAVVQQNPSLNNLYSTIDGGFVGVAEQILSRKVALQNAVEQQVDSSEIVNLMAGVLEGGGSVSNEFQDLLAANPLMAVQVHKELSEIYNGGFADAADQLLTELSNQQLKRFEAAADNLPQVLSGSEFTALNSADRTAYLETLTPAQKNDLLKDLGNAGKDSSHPAIIARADIIAKVITSFDGEQRQFEAAQFAFSNLNFETSEGEVEDSNLESILASVVAEYAIETNPKLLTEGTSELGLDIVRLAGLVGVTGVKFSRSLLIGSSNEDLAEILLAQKYITGSTPSEEFQDLLSKSPFRAVQVYNKLSSDIYLEQFISLNPDITPEQVSNSRGLADQLLADLSPEQRASFNTEYLN